MKERVQKQIKQYVPSIAVGVICLVIVLVIFKLPIIEKNSPQIDLSEYSSINDICELATLKSFYHNVVVYEQKPDKGIKLFTDIAFWPFSPKTGYKQFWMEYSGVVEAGIDANLVHIYTNADGMIDVFVPDAKVLNVYADIGSLTEPITEEGWFTSISDEEQKNAFASAQTKMRQEAENDQKLLQRAKNNAKTLLEQYIINTGKAMNTEYSVNWIEEPK